MKKFLPMFLIAVSFCLISCGNKTTTEPDVDNTPEVTIEQVTDNQNLDENTNLDENNDENGEETTVSDDNVAPEESVSPTLEAAE